VRWGSETGTPLEHLKRSPQQWWTTPYFGYVMAAHDWHIRPSELGLCRPSEDLSVMLAYIDARARMSDKEHLEQERKSKQPKK